jgi:hypothetical protein
MSYELQIFCGDMKTGWSDPTPQATGKDRSRIKGENESDGLDYNGLKLENFDLICDGPPQIGPSQVGTDEPRNGLV